MNFIHFHHELAFSAAPLRVPLWPLSLMMTQPQVIEVSLEYRSQLQERTCEGL